jgi:4-hydroxy-tetrahydrodipicolinate synthase
MKPRKKAINHLRGVFVPLATPFDSRGNLDERSFRENLRKYAGIPLGGLLVAGSTGEAPYLTERERLRLVTLARKFVRPTQILMAGTGLESTRETIRLSREAAQCGADAFLVVTPNYYKPRMDAAAQIAHYRAVADAVNRPVLIYSIPQFTGIRISVDVIASLAHHPNIAGLKESSGDIEFVRAILRKSRPGFRVMAGSVAILADALRAGAAGGVLSQANFAPELCVRLYEACMNSDGKQVTTIRKRIEPLVTQIALPFGVAGIKAALDLCGYRGGAPRSPLQRLSTAERRRVRAALEASRHG